MREDARRGGTLTRSVARNLFRLEPARATRLFDLGVSQGWVGSGRLGATGTAGVSATQPKPQAVGPSSTAAGATSQEGGKDELVAAAVQ